MGVSPPNNDSTPILADRFGCFNIAKACPNNYFIPIFADTFGCFKLAPAPPNNGVGTCWPILKQPTNLSAGIGVKGAGAMLKQPDVAVGQIWGKVVAGRCWLALFRSSSDSRESGFRGFFGGVARCHPSQNAPTCLESKWHAPGTNGMPCLWVGRALVTNVGVHASLRGLYDHAPFF